MDYDDDEFNPSINTPTETTPTAETTPSQRIMNVSCMSAAAKRRVDSVTVNGVTVKRCLIENTSESNHLDYAHCLPRSTKPFLASSFSFASLTSNNNPLRFSLTTSSLPGTCTGDF
jgi:hypothetical protein